MSPLHVQAVYLLTKEGSSIPSFSEIILKAIGGLAEMIHFFLCFCYE